MEVMSTAVCDVFLVVTHSPFMVLVMANRRFTWKYKKGGVFLF